MHNKTPTEIRLKRLGFSLASRCSICRASEDSIGHLFFSCDLANFIWSLLLHAVGLQLPPCLSASAIWYTLSKDNDTNGMKFMVAIFITVLRCLWKARNEATFEDRRPSLLYIQAHLTEVISFSLKQISKPFVSNQLCALSAFMRIAVDA